MSSIGMRDLRQQASRQQLERLPPDVRTARPAGVLGEIERGGYRWTDDPP